MLQRFAQVAVDGIRPEGHLGLLDSLGRPMEDTVKLEGDAWLATAAEGTATPLAFMYSGQPYPLVVQAGNDYWINAYGLNEPVLAAAFESIYGRELEEAITFAFGHRSQRLEVYPDGRVVQNTFSAPAVYVHAPLAIPDFEPVPPEGI